LATLEAENAALRGDLNRALDASSIAESARLEAERRAEILGKAPVESPRSRVVIESPYAGAVEANVLFARLCMYDSLRRGESPFASHLLYPQVLNDDIPAEREQGINGQLAWIDRCDLVAVYEDNGVSKGMQRAIDYAMKIGKPFNRRRLIEPLDVESPSVGEEEA
jgi:hypothetical protein